MSIPPILAFGDDGSPGADVAWLAVNNHRWPDWHLSVITAQMPETLVPLPPEETRLHEWSPPQPRHVFAEAGFADVKHLTARSDPRLVLLIDCDLLVIGPRGNGLLKALHLGSTADWLLNHPPAPLLIARHGQPIRTAVVCADGSRHADKAIEALTRLPWARELSITVLAIDDGRIDVDLATSRAHRQLEAVGASVQVLVLKGKPTRVIQDHLEQVAPDLVVLGTRGLTGLKHLRVGSTASAVARTAACSVLVACDDSDGDQPE